MLLNNDLDKYFMDLAYQKAVEAESIGEVPVGSVFVLNSNIISIGFNKSISLNDTTAHAEINALRSACLQLQNYRLENVEVYVTLEPCPMCAYALVMARVKRVIFATKDLKVGSFGTVFDFANNNNFNHKIEIVSGVMEEESSTLLKNFFANRR